MYDIVELNKKLVSDLREIAEKLKVEKADKLKKEELVYKILDQQAITPVLVKSEDSAPKAKPATTSDRPSERKPSSQEKEVKPKEGAPSGDGRGTAGHV